MTPSRPIVRARASASQQSSRLSCVAYIYKGGGYETGTQSTARTCRVAAQLRLCGRRRGRLSRNRLDVLDAYVGRFELWFIRHLRKKGFLYRFPHFGGDRLLPAASGIS